MTDFEISVKEVEPIRAAVIRDVVEDYASAGPLFEQIFAELDLYGMEPAGPDMALYYDEEYREQDVDVEAAVPVEEGELPDEARSLIRDLPGATVAFLVRNGPYDDFTEAYQTLMAWIEENGYRIVGPNREIFLQGPRSDAPPAEYVVEIQFPVQER